MDEKNKISINSMPKWFKLAIALLPVALLLCLKYRLDNDFYFLYPTGKYIVENGFPTTDFLSMHSEMKIIVQQWLTDVIFYFTYSNFGLTGMVALVGLTYLVFAFLIYKYFYLISENHFVSSVCALVSDAFMIMCFFVTRPQIFTYVLIILELYALEKYTKTGSIKHLAILPPVSLALINMHCSMWAMLFVFMLPYIVGAVRVNLPKIKLQQEPCCKLLPLLVTAAISLAVGFINPYGLKAMLYITTSFGYDEISSNILEMLPPSFNSLTGKLLIVLLGVMAVISLFYKKGKLTTRFCLMFAGTLLLALMSLKSMAYFIIAGVGAFAYYISDLDFKLSYTKESTEKDKKTRKLLIVLILIALAALAGALAYSHTQQNNTESDSKAVSDKMRNEELDEIIEILEEADGDITLYAGFNTGQYLEFNGYHPYIDGRAELFLKDNNGEFDYMKEYADFKNGTIYYKEFIDKYDFNYIITDKTEKNIALLLDNDEDFELLYEGKKVSLYYRKG